MQPRRILFSQHTFQRKRKFAHLIDACRHKQAAVRPAVDCELAAARELFVDQILCGSLQKKKKD
jgi:hypothetical protein